MILDVTNLNKLIEYEHFKMFNLNTELDLLKKDAWMPSADLTETYYSIPIVQMHKKLLIFQSNNQLFEFQVFPNGLSPAPRVFTKMLKPLYAYLSKICHTLFPIIDDSFVMGKQKNFVSALNPRPRKPFTNRFL